jgi:hypothetical protein
MKVHKHKEINLGLWDWFIILCRDLSYMKQVLTTSSTYSKEESIKTSQNKIKELKAVLLYTHFFYALIIRLQHIHFASKNFISTEYAILFFVLFFNNL